MSPSGIAVGPDDAVYLAALRGQSVWRVPLNPDGSAGTPTRHLQGTYGRIRDIRFVGSRVWITTSNNDRADRLLSTAPLRRRGRLTRAGRALSAWRRAAEHRTT